MKGGNGVETCQQRVSGSRRVKNADNREGNLRWKSYDESRNMHPERKYSEIQ